jgi:hypothetical protein
VSFVFQRQNPEKCTLEQYKNESLSMEHCVFIGGCPRSGTTLLGSLLGAGPGCVTTPESQFITKTAAKIARGELENTPEAIRRALENNFRFTLWGVEAGDLSAGHPAASSPLAEFTRQAVEAYAAKTGRAPGQTWIDHTPGHIKDIVLLQSLFPKAVFLHIIRDGRAAFASVKTLDWGPFGVIQGAQWWLHNVAAGLAAEQAFSPQVIRVHFESLVRNTAAELKRICALLGLEYAEAMLAGDGFSVPAYTREQHALVGQAPEPGVCDAWQQQLSNREVEIFESMTRPLLEYLGYRPHFGQRARSPNRREKCREALQAGLRKAIAQHRHRWWKRKQGQGPAGSRP